MCPQTKNVVDYSTVFQKFYEGSRFNSFAQKERPRGIMWMLDEQYPLLFSFR